MLQEAGDERSLLDRHCLEQRIALEGGEADLNLGAGSASVLTRDQGIEAHGVVEDLQPGPVLRQGAGPDLHELKDGVRGQVHAGVRTQHDGAGLAVADGKHQPLAHTDRQSRAGEEFLVFALTAEVVEVLVGSPPLSAPKRFCRNRSRSNQLPQGHP